MEWVYKEVPFALDDGAGYAKDGRAEVIEPGVADRSGRRRRGVDSPVVGSESRLESRRDRFRNSARAWL